MFSRNKEKNKREVPTVGTRTPTKGHRLSLGRILNWERDRQTSEDAIEQNQIKVARQILRVHIRMAAQRFPLSALQRESLDALRAEVDPEETLRVLEHSADIQEILALAKKINAIVPNAKLDKKELDQPPLAKQNRIRLEELAKRAKK